MPRRSKQSEQLYILLISLVPALIVGFLVKTIPVRIAFSILAFLLTLVMLLILSSNTKAPIYIRIGNSRIPPKAFCYILALIASVFVLTLPDATTVINPDSMWSFLASLPVACLIRVFLAFFLASIFPGAVIYSNLMGELKLNPVEKIGLILLLSYCFTAISGLILLQLQAFSNLSFIIVLMTLVIGLECYKHLKTRDGGMLSDGHSFSVNSAALVLVGIGLVGFSYFQVLPVPPLMGVTGGDVQNYVVAANRLLYSDVSGWWAGSYVWANVFYWFVASLAGIPMLYVYAGLQFYQIVLASSFYFFVRTLFPKHKEVASIATLLCFFGAGVSSCLMVNLMITNPSMFADYMTGGTTEVLSFFFRHTGGPGITPLVLAASTFDIGLVFYALAFTCRGLTVKEQKPLDYFLPAFFASAAFFSHSVNLVLVPFFTVLFLALFVKSSRRYLFRILLLMIALVILLDPLSKWFFSNLLIDRMARLSLQMSLIGGSAINLAFALSVVVIGLLAASIIFRRKKQTFRISRPIRSLREKFSGNYAKVAFYVFGFSIFVTSVIFYLSNYASIDYTELWKPLTVSPWYYTVFRVYGIVLPFALASVPFMLKVKKNTQILILILLLSMLVPAMLSLLLPLVFYPNIGYERYIGYLLYPLSIMAALALLLSTKPSNGKKTPSLNRRGTKQRQALRIFTFLTIAALISSPLLSQAYIRELYLIPEQSGSSEVAFQAVDWINANIPSGSSVLPLTLSSEKLLSSLALGIHVIPEFQLWWLRDVLMRSRPDIVLYSLVRTGIDYIFTTDEELSELRGGFQGSYFKFTILSFPEVYHNDKIVIFKVPELPLYKDSNIILVNPSSSDNEPGIENAFRLLITSRTRFSVVDDSSLLALKPGSVYLFTGGESLPMASCDILENIKQGASVVSFDSESIYQILNVTYPGENWTIPTSSLTGWDIESSGVTFGIGHDNTLASTLLAEGNSGGGGDFILRYTPSSSLDLREISFIELWLKTSISGDFYVGLLNNLQAYEVWWGRYDTRYKIEIRDTGEWMRLLLPMSEPTFLEPGFNFSKVNFIRIGMTGLDPNQSFTFSVGGIRALRGIGEIDFADGMVIPDEGLAIYKTYNPPFGEVIANCSLVNGSTVPYIMRARIGNGSLYFVDTISPVDIQHQEEYNTVLNHTGLLLQDLFNAAALPEEKMLFPLPDHLFRQVWFYPLDFAFTLSDLYGLLFWQSDMSLSGDLEIQSSRIYLTNEHLTTEEVRICSDQGNLTFQDATLYNATFVGEGKILANSSIMAVVNSYAGLYSMMNIDDSGQCQMSLWDANASFQLNIGGNIQNISATHVTVSLFFDHSSFIIRAKQPTIQVNGHARGMAQGILTYDFYATRQQIRDFSGELEFTVLYCSNIIYSKLI